MTLKQIALIFSIFNCLLWSCSGITEKVSIVEYSEGRQRLNINQVDKYGEPIDSIFVQTIGLDTAVTGENVKYKSFLSNKDYQLRRAYFHCNINNSTLIDTSTYKLDNCIKELIVENDSVYIEFTTGGTGHHKFSDMILISVDADNIVRYHNGTFNYFVMQENVR